MRTTRSRTTRGHPSTARVAGNCGGGAWGRIGGPPAPAARAAQTPPAGLSSAQVAERRSRGLTNAGGEHTSRSVAHILRANILTRFNLILGVLLAVIVAFGQPQDALFGVVLVTNA